MRPPGIWFSTSIVFAFTFALNFFIRVAGPEDIHSTGIVMDFLQSHSYWLSFALFLGTTLLVYIGFWVWGFILGLKTPGVLEFWKMVKDHPDEAYDWFCQSDAWEVRIHPLDKGYEKEFSTESWAGPYDLWVPNIGKRICLFGKVGHYEKTREQFIQMIGASKSQNTKTLESIESQALTSKQDPHQARKGKTLREKAEDAPIMLRILIDIIQAQFEREYPQVLHLPQWATFQMAASVAGCAALAIRLHFDVPEDQRTPLELAMRKVLAKRYPESEQAYEECNRFVTEGIIDIPRQERGKYLFVLVAMWVYAVISEGNKMEQEEWIVGRLAEIYQNDEPDHAK